MERDEEVVEAASRELEEECGLKVEAEQLEKVGHLEYEFKDQVRKMLDMTFYLQSLVLVDPTENHGDEHLQGCVLVGGPAGDGGDGPDVVRPVRDPVHQHVGRQQLLAGQSK